MFQSDFILREIEGLTRLLAKTLFQKDLQTNDLIDENGMLSEEDFFLHTLLMMVDEGKINEAENLLHERIEQSPQKQHLKTAIAFYDRLNRFSSVELESFDFSREEILEGLAAIQKWYPIE